MVEHERIEITHYQSAFIERESKHTIKIDIHSDRDISSELLGNKKKRHLLIETELTS